MRLRHKLIFGFGGLLLILLLVSGLSIFFLTRYSHALQRAFRENYNSAIYCDRMVADADRLNASVEEALWEKPPPAGIALPKIQLDFDRNLKLQFDNVSLPGERQLTEALRDTWQQYQAVLQQIGLGSSELERQRLFRQKLLPQYQQIKRLASTIASLNMENMASVDGEGTRKLRAVRQLLILFAIAGTVLAIALIAAVGATILKPLRALTHSAHQIATGDLELNLRVSSPDELGQLASAFNSMAARLREFRRIDHERLLRVQETTQLAIDSLPDAVFVVGPDGTIEISNKTAASHFQITPGITVRSLRLKWLEDLYEKVSATCQSWDPQGYSSAIQLFDNGKERFLLPRAVPMSDGAGGLSGVTVILVDVTQLRHADELKSGLVSTVSHELRTPLTSIRLAILMLAEQKLGTLNTSQTKLIGAAREDSDRLCNIIENLLSISRIESGGQKFELRQMKAAEIVSLAVDPLRDQFSARQIRLDVDLLPDVPNVQADPDLIGYALTNLLSNALKYTPRGGGVRLTVENDTDRVRFSVADTGPGVPTEYRQKVFEKFFRMPQRQGPSGVGLGLAVAKEIVEAHSGSIGYLDREGGGSIFWFSLNAEPVSPPRQISMGHTASRR